MSALPLPKVLRLLSSEVRICPPVANWRFEIGAEVMRRFGDVAVERVAASVRALRGAV